MSADGKLEAPSAPEPPLLHTIEEAADVLKVGRTLAYALARRDEETTGLDGLPVIQLGNCLRVPRRALLELALNGRTVPLGELTPAGSDARRALDAELTRINRIGCEADPEPEQNAPRVLNVRTAASGHEPPDDRVRREPASEPEVGDDCRCCFPEAEQRLRRFVTRRCRGRDRSPCPHRRA